MTQKNHSKRKFFPVIAIFLIFFIPFGFAWYTYQGHSIFNKTTNRGTLIKPPINILNLPLTNAQGEAIKEPALLGHWLFVYVSPNKCTEICQRNLYAMRQIRKATGKEQMRVRRAILTFTGAAKQSTLNNLLQNDYKGTAHFKISRRKFAELIQNQPSAKLALTTGYLYLVDPQGNLMMGYAPNTKPDNILKDLEKLLKVSQVG